MEFEEFYKHLENLCGERLDNLFEGKQQLVKFYESLPQVISGDDLAKYAEGFKQGIGLGKIIERQNTQQTISKLNRDIARFKREKNMGGSSFRRTYD